MARALDLLIVDDDPAQATLIEALLGHLNLPHHCYYAPNGLKALAFLKREHPFENAPKPSLVLLDMNMPGMNGCEVLHYMKSDPEIRSIPVIMLSSSNALQDVDACYKEHANAYISKPRDLESTLDVLRQLDRFWGDTVVLPR